MKILATLLAATMLTVQVPPPWRGSTTAGVTISDRPGAMRLNNVGGASVDFWRDAAPRLSGAYTVRATLRKVNGRRHEGYGILFGGRNLGTDSAQYSYVLIRGDGAVLIKKRDGAATPVVRDWAVAAAVRQDDAQSHAENALEVRVTATEVVVSVNGTEVARTPASALYTTGIAGIRLSHQMQVDVQQWVVSR